MLGFSRKTVPPAISLSDDFLRKRLRVLFVDDQPIPQIENLRMEGFNVFHLYDVENIPSVIAQEFHVVFCDIQGVGRRFSVDEEGASLIKELRNGLPYAEIVAYSAHAYQPGSSHDQVIRKVAHSVIKKDANLSEYKTEILRGGREVFSLDRLVEAAAKTSGIPSETVRRDISDAIAGRNKDKLSERLAVLQKAGEVSKTVVEIAVLISSVVGSS